MALGGENVAGKTTLVKLLARLYDPDEGRILLDGVDLREYDLNSLRKNIGVIFQDFVRYDFILKENIGVSQVRSEEHTSELQSLRHLVCRLLLEKKIEDPLAAQLVSPGPDHRVLISH